MTFETATNQADFKEVLAMLLEVMSKGYFVRLTASQVHEPPKQNPVMFKAQVGHTMGRLLQTTTITHQNALEALCGAYRHHREEWHPNEAESADCAECEGEAVASKDDAARFPWAVHCLTENCSGGYEVRGLHRGDVIAKWNAHQWGDR